VDFQEAQDRRDASAPEGADRRETTRKRAADARLRRTIRETLARQRSAPAAPRAPGLRVVRDDRP